MIAEPAPRRSSLTLVTSHAMRVIHSPAPFVDEEFSFILNKLVAGAIVVYPCWPLLTTSLFAAATFA
jgi:hypothetical protein